MCQYPPITQTCSSFTSPSSSTNASTTRQRIRSITLRQPFLDVNQLSLPNSFAIQTMVVSLSLSRFIPRLHNQHKMHNQRPLLYTKLLKLFQRSPRQCLMSALCTRASCKFQSLRCSSPILTIVCASITMVERNKACNKLSQRRILTESSFVFLLFSQ